MFKKKELIQFSRDRLSVTLLAAFLLTMIILFIMTLANIRVSDVQLPVRYSEYGSTNIYRDRWYSLLSFGLFALVVGGMNSYLIVKLHSIRKGLSLGLSVTSVFVGVVALVVATAVFRLVALSL